ncbi:cytochrome P450 [Yimella sp. cx-573]|nr:cytochrome P450 [Yimella sp. cx-573]
MRPDPKRAVRWGLEHALPRQLVRVAARRGDLQAQLFFAAEEHDTAELVGEFDRVRQAGSLAATRMGFITVDHAVVREVLSSNDMRTGFPLAEDSKVTKALRWAKFGYIHPLRPPSLLATEPPDHTRYRKLVTRVFTARAVEALRPQVQSIAEGLLDDVAEESVVDLASGYCAKLPVIVISQILGVPEDEHDYVLELGAGAAPSLDFGLSWKAAGDVERSLQRFDSWLDQHIERLRREPGDNLMSQLIAARDEEGGLDEIELKSIAGLVLAAGFETTVNLMSNAIALFADNPGQLALLRDDPSLWGNAVDEALRIDPPVLLTARSAVRNTRIADKLVSEQHMVTTVLAGANRDPEVFPDPHRFDVARDNAREHLSFSGGRHFCLGAALARMEAEIGLRTLYERYPHLEVLPGRTRRTTRVLRGFERLPARLGTSASVAVS